GACASACGSGGSLRRARGRGVRKASRNCGGASSRGRSPRAAFSSSGRAAPDRHCFHGREPALRSLPSTHEGAPRTGAGGKLEAGEVSQGGTLGKTRVGAYICLNERRQSPF